MQTYRCRRCGQVLAAFVTAVPGIALPFSHQAATMQLEAARDRHRDRCPGHREPAEEIAEKRPAKAFKVDGVVVRPKSRQQGAT
jgi:hypothetical protein